MKLPSLKHLFHHASHTLQRFPFALLSAGVGTFAALTLIDYGGGARHDGILHNLLVTAALGLPLFTILPILAEKWGWRQSKNLLLQIGGALLLAAYFISLSPDVFGSPYLHLIRFFLLNIALHALVAFAPYTGKEDLTGFWQYNKSLFLRFLTAVLYSGVLYVGLVIALLAVEHLFDLDIDGKRYGQLWVLIAGMFNTWFFLAGVPENLAALNQETHYPKGLKIFTQYVLIPLVVIYLVILYVYEAKIIINWSWPKGWVANLVLGFSVSGILALLLVYPAQEQAENRWIKTFAKWYYVALIPLVIMLLLAIARRLSDYGVTENRYFVLVLGLCLSLVVLYFVLSRHQNLRVIPITLCVVAFLSAFGPWGAFAVSERSQMKRLKSLLAKNSILVNDVIRKADQPIAFSDTKEISSIVNYLHRVHGLARIQPWFDQDLKIGQKARTDSVEVESRYSQPSYVVGLMGLKFVNEWETQIDSNFFFTANPQTPLDIAGYESFIRAQNIGRAASSQTIAAGKENYMMRFDKDGSTLAFYKEVNATDTLTVHLAPLVERLVQEFGTSNAYTPIAPDKMRLEQSTGKMKVKIYFSSLNCRKAGESVMVDHATMDLLFGRVSD